MKTRMGIYKYIFYIFLISFVILSNISSVYAISLSEMEGKVNDFMEKGKSESNIDTTEITKEFKELGQILTLIGAGVMVGVTAYMGIKYLTSGPDAQAKLKVQLIGVVVSGMVIFGAYYIWKLVINIAKTL